MVQITRVYTKSGDKGKTSLGFGGRVSKASLRIDFLGTLDEANAAMGLALFHVSEDIQDLLASIQSRLFDMGAEVCMPGKEEDNPWILEEDVTLLESYIDQYNASLPDLKSFVLPGGTEGAARLHFARTVIRRAERQAVVLQETPDEPLRTEVVQYLNRLSDFLFVLARYANKKGTSEVFWKPKLSKPTS